MCWHNIPSAFFSRRHIPLVILRFTMTSDDDRHKISVNNFFEDPEVVFVGVVGSLLTQLGDAFLQNRRYYHL